MKRSIPLQGKRLVSLLVAVVLVVAVAFGCQDYGLPELESGSTSSSSVSETNSSKPASVPDSSSSLPPSSLPAVSSNIPSSDAPSEPEEKISQLPVKQVLEDVKSHEQEEPVPDTPAPPPVVNPPDPVAPDWPGSSSQPGHQEGETGYLIYLSPSNQNHNEYVNGGTEAYYMNQIALAMVPYLKASGVGYVMADMDTNLYHRAQQSDAAGCDLYLALHSNAANQMRRGTIAFYKKGSSGGARFAQTVASNLGLISETPDEIITQYDPWEPGEKGFIETREPKAPSVLLEVAYHDNVADANWIKGNLGAIAKNLAQSVTDYLGIPFQDPNALIEVQEISISPTEKELYVGGFTTLQVKLSPDNATDQTVAWSSTAPNVATVNNAGVVNALTSGTAVITATASNGKTASCTVNVISVEVDSITLSQKTATLNYGDTLTLAAQLEPGYATDQTVVWSTSDDTVATVSKQGVVNAVGKGVAEITATTANGLTAVCTVTVIDSHNDNSSAESGSSSAKPTPAPPLDVDSNLPPEDKNPDSTTTLVEE